MRIIVDGDACPVKKIIVDIAKQSKLEVIMVSDINHLINDGYSKVITVDQDADSADMKIVNIAVKNDLVLTADYGLASLVLAPGLRCMDFNGMEYTSLNIDLLLLQRFTSAKARRSGKKTSGPSKRKNKNNEDFEFKLKTVISEMINLN